MIKLIACDMDGTLLDSQKRISPLIAPLVKRLGDMGVIFAAASGRSRQSLLSYFHDLPVALVADNGGTAYSALREPVFVSGIPFEKAAPALDAVRSAPYMHPALCGLNGVYMQSGESEETKAFISRFFNGFVFETPSVERVFELDRVVKISVSTGADNSMAQRGRSRLLGFESDFTIALSGDGWVDLMNAGVSKGDTLRRLCGHYGVSPDETMVFGDYLNDRDMLLMTPHSYAMANAHPEIKSICSAVTRYTNDENGAIREICDVFKLSV